MPLVSIIVLNWNHPEVIDICLRSLQITRDVDYEVVVVDNGSEPGVVEALKQHQAEGRIQTLVPEPVNHFFSAGNNLGFRHADPGSEFVLLLNSDVAAIHPKWLLKLLGWMDGTIAHRPTVWGLKPTKPKPGPYDIVSCGWSHDINVTPGNARPEGWCCLFRRTAYQDMSPDFPFLYGFEEMIGKSIRAGARCGVLFNYAPYVVHREGGSGKTTEIRNNREPDMSAWLSGLAIETLDFTLGEDEHSSYLDW